MYKLNGNILLSSEYDILLKLRDELAVAGIQRFRTIRIGQKDIQFTCPVHSDGQERKPSCGITIVDKPDAPSGTVHCFSCGYTGNLEQLVSYCFGYNDLGNFGKKWLAKNFLSVAIENRKDLNLDTSRKVLAKIPEYVAEDELSLYRYTHPYMYQRNLTDEIIEKFDVGYDKLKKHITFPVYNNEGNCLFVVRRSVGYKFFQYPPNVVKPVYGLPYLERETKEVIVCESVFNTLSCWRYGKSSVSLLGLGNNYQFEQLKKLPVRKYILAFDPDEAGKWATERFKSIMRRSKIVSRLSIPKGKDINDLSADEFLSLKEVY